MGTIEVLGIRAVGRHGVLPEEQLRSQPFEVDLRLDADLTRAAASDRLEDTVDYALLTEAVARTVELESYRLLERLADRIAGVCIALDGVTSVEVTVRKLRPPIPVHVTSVGVTLRRQQVGAPQASPSPPAPEARHSPPAPEARHSPPEARHSPPTGGRRIAHPGVTGERGPRRRAHLGLGSNLGDRLAFLQGAVDGMAATTGVTVAGISRVYETAPVGGPEQGPYLNAVVSLDTDLEPAALLTLARSIEEDAQRRRTGRWGPRTLDVDVLLVGDEVVDTPELTVPHPRLRERGFVLAPLADVAPGLVTVPPDGWRGVRRTGLRLVAPSEAEADPSARSLCAEDAP